VSRDMNLGVLNANSSKMAKDTTLKFGVRSPATVMTYPERVYEKWAWLVSHGT